MRTFLILIVLAFWHSPALAAPECYENAKNPAHEFPFADATSISQVTSLSYDGKSCTSIQLVQGMPILEQEMYVPFRLVYESYAKAIQDNDHKALMQISAYLRPTPRSFSQWIDLFEVEEGFSVELGGVNNAIKIIRFLKPSSYFSKLLIEDRSTPESLKPHITWPMLYFLMGGVMYPDGKTTSSKMPPTKVQQVLSVYFPLYTIVGNYVTRDYSLTLY